MHIHVPEAVSHLNVMTFSLVSSSGQIWMFFTLLVRLYKLIIIIWWIVCFSCLLLNLFLCVIMFLLINNIDWCMGIKGYWLCENKCYSLHWIWFAVVLWTPITQRQTSQAYVDSDLHNSTPETRLSVVEITHWLSSFQKKKEEHKEPAHNPISRDLETLQWNLHILQKLERVLCSQE